MKVAITLRLVDGAEFKATAEDASTDDIAAVKERIEDAVDGSYYTLECDDGTWVAVPTREIRAIMVKAG